MRKENIYKDIGIADIAIIYCISDGSYDRWTGVVVDVTSRYAKVYDRIRQMYFLFHCEPIVFMIISQF